MLKKILIMCAVALAVGAASPSSGTDKTNATIGVPSGLYKLDKSHASLVFQVDHLGFAKYVARFTGFDATLTFDPANPAAARVEASVDPASLDLSNPPAGFREMLLGAQWLNAIQYPKMVFRSNKVELTGGTNARILGDFTFHGVTKPVVLNVVFNGGYPGHPMDPNARIGFSAKGVLKRSDFGMTIGIPAPGSKLGVSDEVEFAIEAEFTGPPLTGSAKSQ